MELHKDGRIAERDIRTWLFNPFHYIAGGKAMAIGLVFLLLTGFVGFLSNSHFDGVLDFHTGAPATLWISMSEGLIDWLVMGLLLFIGGNIISRSRVRVVDVFGTQVLARFPMLVTAVFALLPGYKHFAGHLAAQYVKTLPDIQTSSADTVVFAITILVAILMLIWMVTLMYRAFSVSCNVKGGKAIGVFITSLIIGEVLSKLLIIALMNISVVNPLYGIASAEEQKSIIAPWLSGEETTYNWTTKQKQVIGETVYIIKEIVHPRGNSYEITANTQIGTFKDDTQVVVSAKNLLPFTVHRILNGNGKAEINGIYESDRLEITADTPSGKKSLDVKLAEDTYDNEEILFLIRAFPLKSDYITSFNFAVVATGVKGKCTLKVLNQEKVKVAAGEFETYKVEFDFGAMGPKMYAWYGVTKPCYLIKYDNSNILCELKETKHLPISKFQNKE